MKRKAMKKKAMKKKAMKRKAMKKRPARAAKKAPARRKAARPRKQTSMDHDAMMQMWQKAMTPGAGHQRLEPLVGSWHARTTFTMMPGASPSVSEGTSEHRWVLGGRFLEQAYKGMSMGMPFEGLGYTAYDNARSRYVGSWMDTFGTGLMNSIGIGKPNDRSIDFEAEAFEPSGRKVKFQCRVAIQDRDHHTYEMWTKAPNGKKFRSMLVEYTRR